MTVNVQKHRYRIAGRQSSPRLNARNNGHMHALYVLLTVICSAGIFAGAYAFGIGGGDWNEVIAARSGRGFLKTFSDDLIIIFSYILICFLGGFSSLGKPAACLLCFFRGMGAGFLSACVFSGGPGGISPKTAADILPFEALSTAAVIFAARENICLSDITAGRTFGSPDGTPADLKLYLAKFSVISFAAVLSATADGLLSA